MIRISSIKINKPIATTEPIPQKLESCTKAQNERTDHCFSLRVQLYRDFYVLCLVVLQSGQAVYQVPQVDLNGHLILRLFVMTCDVGG
jgi:hypothetical protein